MNKQLIGFLAILAALAVLALCAVFVFSLFGTYGKGQLPSRVLLEADFEQPIEEYMPEQPVTKVFGGEAPTTRDIVDALDRAAKDDRVTGLVARLGAVPMGLAQIQEIRDAVGRFRAAGKPTVAWAETFGEFGPGNGSYYLATAFETVYLQPSGDVGLTGLMYESPFVRGMFDKLDVVPRMDHRYEYKNAMNFYTEKKFNEPHREAMKALMDSQFSQMVAGVAKGRGLSDEQVRKVFDDGPYLGRQAVDAKLVDGLLYRDEVYGRAREKMGKEAKLLYLEKYLERAGRPHDSGPKIALIYGVGAVQRGAGGFSPLSGVAMGSDTVAAAFRKARNDDDVRAIVFRVDSPGGSYVASDTIWRETQLTRKAGKPVVVTMGNLAGSGGYFVAMGADKIVAQPGTITASIGVVGGKLLTSGFWEKLGITYDEVHTSENSTMFTGSQDYTPKEWDKFQQWLDRVYADFTSKVADGRKLPKEKVLQVAKGRIWTGEDALHLGLVDALGGFDVALKLAKEAAKIPASDDVTIVVYPRKKSFFEALTQQAPENSEGEAWSEAGAALREDLRPALGLIRELGLAANPPGVLTMPLMSPPRR
ncbi:MAG TPA: signal peptide peptidase SppA [Candidatus Polarisedimenticolaceae bacterium]|nr:signal peptide peptidase SppA [Candidatus Polarisedimenticolaceae bacterium]